MVFHGVRHDLPHRQDAVHRPLSKPRLPLQLRAGDVLSVPIIVFKFRGSRWYRPRQGTSLLLLPLTLFPVPTRSFLPLTPVNLFWCLFRSGISSCVLTSTTVYLIPEVPIIFSGNVSYTDSTNPSLGRNYRNQSSFLDGWIHKDVVKYSVKRMSGIVKDQVKVAFLFYFISLKFLSKTLECYTVLIRTTTFSTLFCVRDGNVVHVPYLPVSVYSSIDFNSNKRSDTRVFPFLTYNL